MQGLERVTVLVAEDNMQIRNLIVSVLNQVGIGNILRANDGLEAINLMKEMRRNPGKVGASEVDLVIADWHMEPVDGATLLRWLRRHQDSPDKMMPFFMLTGYTDVEKVEFARDLGVSEFIAKPFSVQDFIAHIQAAVKDDRRYVAAPGYFGPDRRRRDFEVENDLRGTSTAKVKFIESPRRLFSKTGGDVQISPQQIAGVLKELDDMKEDFTGWIREDFDKMEAIFVQAKEIEDETARAGLIRTIAPYCHELRGQGGVFGYSLVSVVSESLHEFTSSIIAMPPDGMKLVRTHLDMLKAIIRENIAGDGGAFGPELMNSLKLANYNFVQKASNERLVSRTFVRKARLGPQALLDNPHAMAG